MGILEFVANLLISTGAVAASAYLLPGVEVGTFGTALAVAVVLGILNAVLKPILILLTLPVTILTLGLFSFVITAAIVLLTASIVPGFMVDSFWWGLAFALILGVVSAFFGIFKPK